MLHNAKYFSTLDLASVYCQVRVRGEDREKTAFVTAQGLYEFNVMPFGLSNRPASYQPYVTQILAEMIGIACLAYIDDIIVFGRTIQKHNKRLANIS